eukprot:gene22998-31307_t
MALSFRIFPPQDLVHYAIVLKPFDEYHSKGYQTSGKGKCGTPRQLSGIQFSFPLSQDLSDIPYNKLIEVPFTVSQSLLCDEYVDLEVQIVSACEMGMDVFQYGITNQKIDYSKRLPSPSSSTGTFSVRWPPAGRRKLSPINNQSSSAVHSKDFSDTKYEIASLDDVLTRSQTDFMNKLLVENENSKVDQKELMQKLLAENEERMLRLLADSTRRVQVELASYVFAGGAVMFSVPYYMRQTTEPLDKRTRMSGSQRQRGLYFNAGSQDAGPDPDWDPVTNTYTGYDKHNRVRPPRATVTSSSTPPSSAADNPPPQQS